MKSIFNLNVKLNVLIILFVITQILCFSIDKETIVELTSLERNELLNEAKKMESKLATDKNDYNVISKLGIAYQILAMKFEQKVSGKNEKYLVQSLKIKKDPVILCYFGASYYIKARDSINPFNKMKYVKTGSQIIDGAVLKEPDNFLIRMLRINMSSKNKKMGRLPIAKQDIDYCENMYKEGKITKAEYTELLLGKGRYYTASENIKKAQEIYNNIISDYPDTEAANQAKKRMEKLKN